MAKYAVSGPHEGPNGTQQWQLHCPGGTKYFSFDISKESQAELENRCEGSPTYKAPLDLDLPDEKLHPVTPKPGIKTPPD